MYTPAMHFCISPVYLYISHPPPQTPQVRGGSVSRRGHAQYAGNRAPLAGGTKPAAPHPPNASRSSGEGVWGERRFSLGSGLSPSVPLCITLLNLLFSQSCPHVEKSGDFGFSTGWYSQAVERVKSGAKLEHLGKKWGKSAEIFEKGKWKKEGIKRHGREYR